MVSYGVAYTGDFVLTQMVEIQEDSFRFDGPAFAVVSSPRDVVEQAGKIHEDHQSLDRIVSCARVRIDKEQGGESMLSLCCD